MNALYDAIYDALAAHAGIAATVGTRIYRGKAQGAAYPLITFQRVGGGDDTETPADKLDEMFLVQGVSQVSSAEAEGIAEDIGEALHKVTLTVSGWTNIWTAVAGHLEAVELDTGSGRVSWTAGRQIRVILSR